MGLIDELKARLAALLGLGEFQEARARVQEAVINGLQMQLTWRISRKGLLHAVLERPLYVVCQYVSAFALSEPPSLDAHRVCAHCRRMTA